MYCPARWIRPKLGSFDRSFRKICPPPILWALQSIRAPPCFLIANYTTIYIVAVNIHGTLVLNLFFSFPNLQLYLSLSKLQKLDLSASSAFGNWKRNNLRQFVNTTAQVTNVRSINSGFYKWKTIDDNQKSSFRNGLLISNFFIAHLWILVRYKTKGAVGVVSTYCAFAHLAIECLMANYCTRWRRIFKGLSHDGGRVEFSKKPPGHFH
jgi:hypothetical protein